MVSRSPFEVPEPIRELAEKNVAQARAAYGQFMDAMAQAVEMWSRAMPSNEVTAGFKVAQERAIRFAKGGWWRSSRRAVSCTRSERGWRHGRCRRCSREGCPTSKPTSA